MLDYYLKEKQTDAVKLEIFDAAGKLVRRYASTDEVPKTNPDEIDIPMYWIHDAQPLVGGGGDAPVRVGFAIRVCGRRGGDRGEAAAGRWRFPDVTREVDGGGEDIVRAAGM